MASSMILQSLNEVINGLAAIPYTWNKSKYRDDRPAKTKLFQHIAKWNNQLDLFEDGKLLPFQTPAAFLEILSMNVQPFLGAGDFVELGLRIHILHYQLDAGNGNFDDNSDVYGYRDLVKTYMRGFKITYGGKLQQVSEHQDFDHMNVYHYIMDFKVAMIDYKGTVNDPDQPFVVAVDPPQPSGEFPLTENIIVESYPLP